MMASGRVNVKPLITHTYKLEETLQAFERAKTGEGGAIKVKGGRGERAGKEGGGGGDRGESGRREGGGDERERERRGSHPSVETMDLHDW